MRALDAFGAFRVVVTVNVSTVMFIPRVVDVYKVDIDADEMFELTMI